MRAGRLAMSLPPPLKVRKLQETLHAKAKGSPSYRFYALYDKVYRRDVLEFAFDRCRSNGGAPGIETIRDRVAQMATVLVLEPIFETDLEPEQHAYWAEHSALDAVRQVHGLLNSGHTEVVDADLSGYFDSIPHAELMKSIARRISDRHLLHLVKMWLEAPVEETDEQGRKRRTTRNKDERRG